MVLEGFFSFSLVSELTNGTPFCFVLHIQKKEDARIAEERAKLKYQKDHMYDDIHTVDNMRSNEDAAYESDDFM